MTFVITQTRDADDAILMNHPQKRNALSEALIDEVTVALIDFREDKISTAVLLRCGGMESYGL